LPYQLLAGLRVLTLAEFCEVLGGYRSGKAKLRGQTALPLACNHAAL